MFPTILQDKSDPSTTPTSDKTGPPSPRSPAAATAARAAALQAEVAALVAQSGGGWEDGAGFSGDDVFTDGVVVTANDLLELGELLSSDDGDDDDNNNDTNDNHEDDGKGRKSGDTGEDSACCRRGCRSFYSFYSLGRGKPLHSNAQQRDRLLARRGFPVAQLRCCNEPQIQAS